MKKVLETTGSTPMDTNRAQLADLGGVEFPVFREITPEDLMNYYSKGWVVFQLGKGFEIFIAMKADNAKVIWVASKIGEA